MKIDYTIILKNIPNLQKPVLQYVFEDLKLKHEENTLWMEFGVFSGKSINYISKFTGDFVYGFDSFCGLPEDWRSGYLKGSFDMKGNLPKTNSNVKLIQGLFEETLETFIQENNKKVSFLHMDADLYSSTKYVLDNLKNFIAENCIIVFDELINYEGYDNQNGELRALYEFLQENSVEYEWIGMNGTIGMEGGIHEQVAIKIKKISK